MLHKVVNLSFVGGDMLEGPDDVYNLKYFAYSIPFSAAGAAGDPSHLPLMMKVSCTAAVSTSETEEIF